MKAHAVFLALASLVMIAAADYCPTTVNWSAWRVTTSEYLCATQLDRRYTIMNLFASDPAKTWVLNRTANKHYVKVVEPGDRFTIASNELTTIDGLRIMNGYNKSQHLYEMNDAVSEIQIYAGEKLVKTTRLSDRMGWHTVSIPPIKLGDLPSGYSMDLTIKVTGVRKGRVHDLCISGLQLLHRGKVQPWRLDKTIIFNAGGETEPSNTELWTPTGHHIVTDRGNNLEGPMMSPSGRYIMGTDCPAHSISLWVVDSDTGRIIYRKRMFDEPDPEYPHVYHASAKWMGERSVDIRFEVQLADTTYVRRQVKF